MVVKLCKKPEIMQEALVLYGSTDFGSPQYSGDILWRARFRAPDPFWLVEIAGRPHLFVSSLEYGRAVKEARAGRVMLLERRRGEEAIDTIIGFLRSKHITGVMVSKQFPYAAGRALEKRFRVEVRRDTLYPERAEKTVWEVAEMQKVQRACERAMARAMDFLAACRIRGRYLYSGQTRATSEMLRAAIDRALYEDGCLGIGTIASCGLQAADPHALGTGALRPYEPMVLDIFPVSRATHYYADMTRTVFKGEPSLDMQRMYEAVRAAQDQAIAMIRPGVRADAIHREAARSLESWGYKTDLSKRPPEGFIHGLGHGVGLDIHEEPYLGAGSSSVLEVGNVITVEPGLYYRRARRSAGARGSIIPAGGIRIEDMLVVTKTGSRSITRFPKNLGDMIIS